MSLFRDKETLRKWDHLSVDLVLGACYLVAFVVAAFDLHYWIAVWYWAGALPLAAGGCTTYIVSSFLFRRTKYYPRVKLAILLLAFSAVVAFWIPPPYQVRALKVYVIATLAGFLFFWGVPRQKRNGGDRPVQ